MSSEWAQLSELLDICEARLVESRRELDNVLLLLRQARKPIEASLSKVPTSRSGIGDAEFDRDRDELVGLVLAALDRSPAESADFKSALVYRAEDESYRLGRRRLDVTDTERHVLHALWAAMPGAASREDIRATLCSAGGRPSLGAIDVFVSKLRQKLKLASGGTDFLETVRGKGWALKPDLCRTAPASIPITPPEPRPA